MEKKVAGRILLLFALVAIDFPGKSFQEAEAQTVDFTGFVVTIGNTRSVQERVRNSNIIIDAVIGSTIAGGPTIGGTGLWDLEVFLTQGTDSENADFTTQARMDGTVTSFDGADNTLRSGEILTLTQVNVLFDLESRTCMDFNLICARIIKGASPSTTFEIAQVNPSCARVDCKGVVVSQVIPSIINRDQLKQGEANMLEISISLDASSNYGSVTGSNLTQVDVFASMQPDGSGTPYNATVHRSSLFEAGSYGISGPGSTIPRIQATLNLAGIGCRQLSYVCVRVTRGPFSNPRYTLSFDPPEANVACKELTCRGVEGVTLVQGTFSSNPLGEYKSSHVLTIPSITFSSSSMGGSVTSSNQQLWDLEVAAVSNGAVIAGTNVRANLQTGQAGQAFMAGGQLQFTRVTATLNLADYECTNDNTDQVAVRLVRHSQAPVDFTIASEYRFENVECRGLTVTSITVRESSSTPNNGFPLRERTSNQGMVFDAIFGTDGRYGSVRGSNLWQITVGISSVPSPNFNTLLSPSFAQLTSAQRNLGVEGGQSLDLNAVLVDVNYDQVCASRNYFCVRINKDPQRTVLGGSDFLLSGQAVGCVEIDCRGVEITQIQFLPTGLVIQQHRLMSFSGLRVIVYTNPTAGSGSTRNTVNPWNMRLFLNREESLDLSISGDVTGLAESQEFPSGAQTTLSIDSTINLLSSCENMQYLCLYIEQNVNARSQFTFDVARNVQFGCTQISSCTGVEIDRVDVVIVGSNTIFENSGSSRTLTLRLVASRTNNSATMDPSGSGYWQVMAFGSQSASGDGERVALETNVGLTAVQRAEPLGIPSDFGFVTYEILTRNVDCSKLTHVCLELSKNTLQTPSPDFTLVQSGIGCATVDCVGVVIEQTNLEIVSGGVRERATSNEVIVDLRLITHETSAGVEGMRLWSLTMFTATQPDGTGFQRLRMDLPQGNWGNASIINGEAELSGIMLDFDLTNVRCNEIPYVCIELGKDPVSVPAFSLSTVSSSSLIGCAPIPCDGLEITATSLTLSPQSGIVIEHSMNPLVVTFTAGFMSSEDNEGIAGTNLWQLDVFLNDNQDGTGNQQRSTVTVTNLRGGESQPVSSGQSWDFSNISASLPVTDYTCPTNSYLCVQLQKQPERTFTLSVTAPRCVPIECRGVLITSVSFTLTDGDPFVEFASSQSFFLGIMMQSNPQYAGVRGQRLWTYNVFLSPTNENSLNRIAEGAGVYTLADETVTAGQPFTSQINTDLGLSQVSCQDVNYICVIVSKGSDPSIEYTFEQMDESALRACEPIRCQGVDLVRVVPTITSGSPFLEQFDKQLVNLSVALEFSQNTASVSGQDLWDAEVFTNPNNLGTGSRSASETITGLDGNVNRGMMTNVERFAVEFDLSNSICEDVMYLCVRIRKHSMAVPNFQLNPAGGRLACVATNCVGAVIENFQVVRTSSDDLLEVQENRFDFVASFSANELNAGLSDFNGRNIWGFTLFTNDNADGSGPRERQSIVHQPGSIVPGGTLTYGLNFNLDLFNFVCNDGGEDYVCLQVGRGQHLGTDLSVTYPSPVCLTAMCRGVRFLQPVTIQTAESVMLEYTDNHAVTFNFQVNTDLLTTTIENGTNAMGVNVRSLWIVSLTGDNIMENHAPTSPFYQETTASLTPAQATTPYRGSVGTFGMSNVISRMNLSSFYCPPENYYLCVSIDKDPNSSPDFTFENEIQPSGCVEIECRGVYIQGTTVLFPSSQFIRERQANEEVTFNLEVTSDVVSSATTGQFLQLTTYISNVENFNGDRLGESTAPLSSAQQGMTINANQTVIFESLVTTMNLASVDPCNSNGMFFCVAITKNPFTSRPFKLEGNLVGCAPIECRGVLVTSGTAFPAGLMLLREGRGAQTVQLDVTYSAASDWASIFGLNLWQILVFASDESNGEGTVAGSPVVGTLDSNNANLPLRAGSTIRFGVSATLNFGINYRTCSEILYVCGQLAPQIGQEFGFTAQPSFATTACARFDCTGVVITQTDIMVSQGLSVTEDVASFTVRFTLSLLVDFTSSTLETGGSNRWKVVIFGNSRADGLGERTRATEVVLQNIHLTQGATPGLPTTFSDLEVIIDFSNQYCNTLQFLCAEVSAGADRVPSFRLSGLNDEPDRLIGCQKTNCTGVRITGGTLTVPSNIRLTEGLTMDTLDRIDVTYQSHISGAGATGQDLWNLKVFLATSEDGANPSSNVTANLAGTSGSQPLIAGGILNFPDISAVLDTTNVQCSNSPHICVTLEPHQDRSFSLNGYDPQTDSFNDDILTLCSPITCDGVVISENIVEVVQPTGPIYAREDEAFCFNVTLTFAVDGGSVEGSSLWTITAFMSQNENGNPEVQSSEVAITLNATQREMSAIPGNQIAFDNLKANLSLDNLNCPSGEAYLCVRVDSSSDSMPMFSVSGMVIGCARVQCRGLMIESSSVLLVDPDNIRENTEDQTVIVDITLNVAQDSAEFLLQENLWQRARIYTADADGIQSGTTDTFAILTTQQARTPLTRGQPAIIRSVFFSAFSTVGSQCEAIPYFCVTLQHNPIFSVTYLENSQTACARLPCRGVEIVNVDLQGSGPRITERDSAYNLVADVTVDSDVGGAGISGTSLWTLVSFFDTQQDCRGNDFPETRTQNLGISGRTLVAGQTLSLRSLLFLNMNLMNLLCPDGPLYLCVEFGKVEDSSPPFTLSFFPDENTKYASVEATCQGVEVAFSRVTFTSPLTVQEGNPFHSFILNFIVHFSANTAPVSGTNLWELVIYGSRDENGLNSQEFLTTVPLNTEFLRNQPANPDQTIFFLQQLVTVDLRGVRCSNYPYVCVKITRDLASRPAFTFSGDESSRIGCDTTICTGILIDSFVAGISAGTVIFEDQFNQNVRASLTIQSNENADPAVGNNYWRPFIFFNDQPDGNGPAGRISLTEMTIEDVDRYANLPSGGSVTFHPADASVNFTTSCIIGRYMCFEIFNGMDLLTPTETLLGNVVHCFDVDCVGLIVSDTNLEIQVGSTLQEGASTHQVTFVVTVTSSSSGASATLSPMWEVKAFLTNRDNSDGVVAATIVSEAPAENVLSPSERLKEITAGATVDFTAQSSFIIEGLLCEDTQYLCVTFGAVEGSAHSVTPLNGDSQRLVDCAPLSCSGIEVVSSELQLSRGVPLISNQMNQELIVSFEFQTSPNSIPFEGQRLFRIRIFPNNAANGTGVTPLNTNVELELNQFTSIQPGTPNLFASLFVVLSLQGVRCDQMPYICGTLLKGTSPSPDYTLQPEIGSPELTACTRMLTCVGIQITEFNVAVDTGLPVPEDASVHIILSTITVSSSPDGGSVDGMSLWVVRVFMSNTSDGQGGRFFEANADIGDARSAALPAGSTIEIDSVAVLSLDGFSCSTTQYLCYEFARDGDASVDFTLEAASTLSNGLINCQQFLCRGVTLDAISFTINSNQQESGFRVFENSPSFQVSLNIDVTVGSDSVTVTGTNLWEVTVFLSNSPDGSGTRLGETIAALTPEQSETSIEAGQIAQLTNVAASLNLANIRCSQLQHLCIEVWSDDNAIPRYRIDDPASQADLRQCQPVSCVGVEILSVVPVFPAGSPILLDMTSLEQIVTFDLEIEANPYAAGIQGTDLWEVAVYITDQNNVGSGTQQISPLIANLSQSERDKPLDTSETLTLEQVAANLVLDSASCEEIRFLCATLQKGQSPNPDFDIQPSGSDSSLTGCTPVECVDAIVTETTMTYGPDSTLEGDPSHTISMNITVNTSRCGKIIPDDGLWQFTVFGSNGNPGDQNTTMVVLNTGLTIAQRNVDFLPCVQRQFSNVEATLDLQSLSCQELTHFCVQIGFYLAYELRGEPDASSLIACSPVRNCGDFEVDLQVTDFDETSINVLWSGGIGDFDFYEISYAPGNGLTPSTVTFPRYGNTRTLNIERLTPGQLYTIAVRLRKAADYQDGNATVMQRTPPQQVTDVNIEDIDPQSFRVTWNPIGGVFDNYVIRVEPGGGEPSSPHFIEKSATAQDFTNLVIATAYSVTVVSRSGDLESTPTEATGFTQPTIPQLRLVEFTSTEISVAWSTPLGYTPDGYRISYSSTPLNLRTMELDRDTRQYTLTNLLPTAQYEIELFAAVVHSSSGTTVLSPSSNLFVTTGPDKPTVVLTSDINSINVTVSLDRGTADFYTIYYRPTFSPTILRVDIPNMSGNQIFYVIEDLLSATEYIIDVVSIYNDVESDVCRRTQTTRVEGPRNLIIVSVTPSSITVSWQSPEGISFEDYRVNVTYGANTATNSVRSTTYSIDNLPAYTDVEISVEARYNGSGVNVYSLPVTARQRTASTRPGPVRNAEIQQVGELPRILLTFDIPEMPNGELVAFFVTYGQQCSGIVPSEKTANITVVSQETVSYTKSFFDDIIRGCSYTFTVTARNQLFDGESVTLGPVFIRLLPPDIIERQPLQTSRQAESTPTTLQLQFTTSSIAEPDSQAIQNYTIIVAELGRESSFYCCDPIYSYKITYADLTLFKILPFSSTSYLWYTIQSLEQMSATAQPVEGESIAEPLPSYNEVREGPYQAFKAKDWPSDGVVNVELGTDLVCGSFRYCNGALKPGTTYLVAIRVYNDQGHATSDFVEYRTKTLYEEYMIYILAGGGAVLLLLIIIIISILLCCCCCCCRNETEPRSSKKSNRKRYESDSDSDSSGDGLDNINLNNATVLVYNPEERTSSAASLASRMEGAITRPVPLSEFAAHVGRLSANSQEGFELEFESLRNFGLNQSTSVAETSDNKAKNRFSNILPYNNSRVVLNGDNDYINASYITGSNRLHEYIATQGPMEHTVNDFWRMIWEQQVPIIVMICDIVEGGKTKCEEYWPPLGEPTAYGEIRVTMLSENQTTKGKERTFKLEVGEQSRTVSHFQFLEWPDKGVPSDTQLFTLFVKDIRSQMRTLPGPVVIHCSDGASRTGVFIALDIMMQGPANETGAVDAYGVVGRLREERAHMVLSKNYYVFLHHAMLNVLLAQVSDSNWSFGATPSNRRDYIPLEDNDLLGTESSL